MVIRKRIVVLYCDVIPTLSFLPTLFGCFFLDTVGLRSTFKIHPRVEIAANEQQRCVQFPRRKQALAKPAVPYQRFCNLSRTPALDCPVNRKCIPWSLGSITTTNNNNNTVVVSELQALQTYITSSPSRWTRALNKLLLHEQIVRNSNQFSKRNRIRDHKINGSIDRLQSPTQSQNKNNRSNTSMDITLQQIKSNSVLGNIQT